MYLCVYVYLRVCFVSLFPRLLSLFSGLRSLISSPLSTRAEHECQKTNKHAIENTLDDEQHDASFYLFSVDIAAFRFMFAFCIFLSCSLSSFLRSSRTSSHEKKQRKIVQRGRFPLSLLFCLFAFSFRFSFACVSLCSSLFCCLLLLCCCCDRLAHSIY